MFLRILIVFLFSSHVVASATERPFGERGSVNAFSGASIKSMAIRSDGRYLFYALTGESQFYALDLLDMARQGDAVATTGTVVSLSLDGDQRLIAVTTQGVQYFNLQYPFEITAETSAYTRDSNDTRTILDACSDKNKNVFIIEQGSNSSLHRVRVVNGITSNTPVPWTNLFASTVTPLSIRCSETAAYLFGTASNESGENQFWVGKFLAASTSLASSADIRTNYSNYDRKDYLLTPKGDRLLFLFRNKNISTDSRLLSVSANNFSSRFELQIPYSARALTSFWNGDQVMDGIFVTDATVSPSVEQLLLSPDSTLSSNTTFPALERGDGLSTAGSITPSRWISTKLDHYKYGITESSGLALVSQVGALQFSADPSGQHLTSSSSISFSIVADEDFTYDIRVDPEPPAKGVSTGISLSTGTNIKSGSLTKDVAKTVTLSLSETGIRTNGRYSVYIFGRGASSNETARLGFQFDYTPPPGPVRNLSAGFGDESAHIFFDRPATGAPTEYYIFFSWDAADLTTMDITAAARSFDTGIPGYTLSSPAIVDANTFRGRYVIAPIENERTLYVRVKAVDSSTTPTQSSDDSADPAAINITTHSTKSLAEALGSSNSCATVSEKEGLKSLVLLLFFAGICWGLRLSGKKIGSSSSRNRRGGD